MKLIILLFGIIASVQGACPAGTLECDGTNSILCDTANNYFLDATTNGCKLISFTNCLVSNIGNYCDVCQTGYYWDATNKVCAALATTELITNCLYYKSDKTCIVCNTNFFLSAATCTAVTTPITGCSLYSDATTCAKCVDGSILNGNVCYATTTVANCSRYSLYDCQTCSTGFWKGALASDTALAQSAITAAAYAMSSDLTAVGSCLQFTVANCVAGTSTSTCTACAPGYNLVNNACVAYTNTPLPNCASYTDLKTCSGCAAGYYLLNNTCTLTPVENTQCNVFSAANVCSTCANKYWSNSGICKPIVIANCSVYSDLKTCSTCAATYILFNNACYATTGNLANCTVLATATTCQTCIAGFYPNSAGVCTANPLSGDALEI